jgi:branched-chain amino acid transport system ATP-binding protein
MMSVLRIKKLTKYFGGLRAVNDFNFLIDEGELVGLIGPNGAGKTTIFNTVMAVYPPTSGEIEFMGQNIVGLKPHQVAQLGIGRTFQKIRVFKGMNVLDNVRLAYHPHSGYGIKDAFLHNALFSKREKELTERAQELLSIFGLEDKQKELCSSLPYGDQHRVEIARALATEPKLLMLDEPTSGMNPREALDMVDLIKFLRDKFKLTVFLIEHQMRVVMGVCERITVIDFGEIIAHGKPDEIRNNPKVIEAYLGERMAKELAAT